jgi:hypothetical protein
MQDLEQTIRERAYHLWMAEGCPEGNAEGHWLAAQSEVLASSSENLRSISAATPKAKRPLKRATKRR